ncbi:MAG: hypothetical protein WAO83_13045 [Fuerstiella sp.]
MAHTRSTPRSVECTASRRTVLGLVLLACAIGPCQIAFADEQQEDLPADVLAAFGRLDRNIKDLDGYLTAIEFNRPAILGTNYFAVSVAGIDSIKDLEEGRGVDPETLGGLYAGFAIPDVAKHLNLARSRGENGELIVRVTSPDGRLRYKGTVVRLYPADRLRELFERRDAFRVEDSRKRTATFAEYVYKRQQELGQSRAGSDNSQIEEMSERYRQLQPVINDYDEAIRSVKTISSIMPGSGQHYFAYSMGGIDVQADLEQRQAVDPETLAAIYADKLAPEYADAFVLSTDGRVKYNDKEVKLYSMANLARCFKYRERLVQKSQR